MTPCAICGDSPGLFCSIGASKGTSLAMTRITVVASAARTAALTKWECHISVLEHHNHPE